LLLALAGLVLAVELTTRTPDPLAWILRQHGASLLALVLGAALTVAVAGGALLAISLLSAYGRVLRRLERLEGDGLGVDQRGAERSKLGLPPGTVAPAFTLPTVGGASLSLPLLVAVIACSSPSPVQIAGLVGLLCRR
jgi:hypothetical protein